ncbi:MAG: sugar transferase [Planctomycetota bacterium]|jgi:exopolysaccharide biosynthesis polyprenyl glycosylphosphotransferase
MIRSYWDSTAMTTVLLCLINLVLINLAFLLAFVIRYGLPFPARNFLPYQNSFLFLTLIHMAALFFLGTYEARFKSSWDLFKRVFSALLVGTLLSVAFVYVFRNRWGAFPTSIFALSFCINLLLVFKVNQFVLRTFKRIRKKVVIIGDGHIDDMMTKKADIERKGIEEIQDLIKCADIDEIIICDRIQNQEDMNLLLFLAQKSKADVVFSPANYLSLLPQRIDGENSCDFLSTFVGKKRDIDEFLIRGLDLIGSVLILLVFLPVMAIIAVLIKISSAGPVIYEQERVGKDGRIFTLHKFRTMVRQAEKNIGPVLANRDDPRVTKVGRILRTTRLDELPQLFNVLRGDMSLVGPRPERPHFVKLHRALRQLRLAVKPGLTGLAQIRSFYDLKPGHKIKYDYLYIQQRSLLLNLYILAKTIPVIFSRKGW